MNEAPGMPGSETLRFDGGETGVLVSHGFTGTTQSMRPLAEGLASAGFSVLAPRLAGHGLSPEAMAKTGARDWIGSVEAALAELQGRCRRVFMTGLSMGGTLTLYMAGAHPGTFAGIIPINAAVRVDSPDMASLAFDPAAPPTVPGIGSDIKDPDSRELAYPAVPVACFAELHALVGVTSALLPRVTCPTLIITSREDHVVPPVNGRLIASAINAGRIEQLWLDNSYHVATIDYDRDLIISESIRFICSVADR